MIILFIIVSGLITALVSAIIKRTRWKKSVKYLWLMYQWLILIPAWLCVLLCSTDIPLISVCCSVITFVILITIIMKKCRKLMKFLSIAILLLWCCILFTNGEDIRYYDFDVPREWYTAYTFDWWCYQIHECLMCTMASWGVTIGVFKFCYAFFYTFLKKNSTEVVEVKKE